MYEWRIEIDYSGSLDAQTLETVATGLPKNSTVISEGEITRFRISMYAQRWARAQSDALAITGQALRSAAILQRGVVRIEVVRGKQIGWLAPTGAVTGSRGACRGTGGLDWGERCTAGDDLCFPAGVR